MTLNATKTLYAVARRCVALPWLCVGLWCAPAIAQDLTLEIGSLEHRVSASKSTETGRHVVGLGWTHRANVARVLIRTEREVLQSERFTLALNVEAGPGLALDGTNDVGGRVILESLPTFPRAKVSVFFGPRLDAAATLDADRTARLSPLAVLGARIPLGPLTAQLLGAAGYSYGSDYRGALRREASVQWVWTP